MNSLAVAVLAVFPALAATAADPMPPAPPVEELVAEALERSPALAAAHAQVAAAAAVVDTAAVLPDPMVEVSVDNMGLTSWTVGEEEMSMIGVSYLQPLFYPGKRDARRNAAAAEVSPRRAGLAAERRRVALEVRLGYAAIYTLDREVASLGAAAEMLDVVGVESAAVARSSPSATVSDAVDGAVPFETFRREHRTFALRGQQAQRDSDVIRHGCKA